MYARSINTDTTPTACLPAAQQPRHALTCVCVWSEQLTELGVNIAGAQAHVVDANDFNAKYLRTKAQRMAHALPALDDSALAAPGGDGEPAAPTAVKKKMPTAVTPSALVDAAAPRWRFGRKSVDAAAAAVRGGAAVVVVDHQSDEAWLVTSAAEVSTSSLVLLSQLGDSLTVSVADGAVACLERDSGAQLVDIYEHNMLAGGERGGLYAREHAPGRAQARVGLLRRLARVVEAANRGQAAALLQDLPSPLAAVLGARKNKDGQDPSASGKDWDNGDAGEGRVLAWQRVQDDCAAQRLLALRVAGGGSGSAGDAAVELLALARVPPVSVSTLMVAEDRMSALSLAAAEALAEGRGLVTTSVDDIACFRNANLEVPTFLEKEQS